MSGWATCFSKSLNANPKYSFLFVLLIPVLFSSGIAFGEHGFPRISLKDLETLTVILPQGNISAPDGGLLIKTRGFGKWEIGSKHEIHDEPEALDNVSHVPNNPVFVCGNIYSDPITYWPRMASFDNGRKLLVVMNARSGYMVNMSIFTVWDWNGDSVSLKGVLSESIAGVMLREDILDIRETKKGEYEVIIRETSGEGVENHEESIWVGRIGSDSYSLSIVARYNSKPNKGEKILLWSYDEKNGQLGIVSAVFLPVTDEVTAEYLPPGEYMVTHITGNKPGDIHKETASANGICAGKMFNESAGWKKIMNHSRQALNRALMKSKYPGMRIAGIKSIALSGGKESITSIKSVMEKESNTVVCESAIESCMYFGEANKELVPVITKRIIRNGGTRADLRFLSVNAKYDLNRTKHALPALIRRIHPYVKYPDESLRMEIFDAIGGLGKEGVPAVPILTQYLDGKYYQSIRDAALINLGRIAEPPGRISALLMARLKEKDYKRRMEGYVAIGQMGGKGSMIWPEVYKRYKENNSEDRWVIIHYVFSRTAEFDPMAMRILREAKNGKDKGMAELARETLDGIAKRTGRGCSSN